VAAGAAILHLHAFGKQGGETLEAGPCAEAILAVREACPGVPVSLSTSAQIESDPARRLRLIERWDVLPDLVTANQGEEGILEVCQLFNSLGVGLEAGLLCHSDAEAFVDSEVPGLTERVLVEPLDSDPATAVAHAAAMERILSGAGITLPQMHHGDGLASWAVNRRGLARGHDIRTGIEDTGQLPDGTDADDNADLVRAAVDLVAAAGRSL
jgi:uncharacterized protein (DUF849 family)